MKKLTTNTVLAKVNEVLDTHTTNEVKEIIGDSTNNNRTLTVRQIIRFFEVNNNFRIANALELIYSKVKAELHEYRNDFNYRTDGFDVNELLFVIEARTHSNTKRALTLALNKSA